MVRRFDREHVEGGYLRFGLVSGLTVLDCGDSHLDRDRWSYPLLADNLRRWSDKPEADCAELFRRMVFNAAVTNNDDHPPSVTLHVRRSELKFTTHEGRLERGNADLQHRAQGANCPQDDAAE